MNSSADASTNTRTAQAVPRTDEYNTGATGAERSRAFRMGMFVMSYAWLIGGFAYFYTRTGEQMVNATDEDGLFEIVSAVALALAAVLFGIAWWRSSGRGQRLWRFRPRRNALYLGFAFVMFMACGEELSWGQHIIGFETPEVIAEHNEQEEFNLHNLWLFDSRVDGDVKAGIWRQLTLVKMFSAFTLGLGVLFPLLHATVPWVRRLNERFRVPVAPLWLAPFLLVTFGIARLGPDLPPETLGTGAMSEVRESMYAYALFVVAAFAAWTERREPRPSGRDGGLAPQPPEA